MIANLFSLTSVAEVKKIALTHTVSSADKLATDFYNNEEGSSVSITVDGSIIPSLKILFL